MEYLIECSCGATATITNNTPDGKFRADQPGWKFISLHRDWEIIAATLTREEYAALPPEPAWHCGRPRHFQKRYTILLADGRAGETRSVLDGKPAGVVSVWLAMGGAA